MFRNLELMRWSSDGEMSRRRPLRATPLTWAGPELGVQPDEALGSSPTAPASFWFPAALGRHRRIPRVRRVPQERRGRRIPRSDIPQERRQLGPPQAPLPASRREAPPAVCRPAHPRSFAVSALLHLSESEAGAGSHVSLQKNFCFRLQGRFLQVRCHAKHFGKSSVDVAFLGDLESLGSVRLVGWSGRLLS